MKRLTAFVAVLALTSASTARAHVGVTDTEIASASAAAVHGVVTAVRVVADPGVGAIYTVVSLEVRRSWGLPDQPTALELKLLGGAVGRRALWVDGQAAFTPGEEVFAFLDVRPRDRTFSVTALGRGKWTIDRATTGAARGAAPAPAGAAGQATRTLETLAALAARAGTRVTAPPDARRRVVSPLAPVPSADLTPGVVAAAAGRWHRADGRGAVTVDASGLTTAPTSMPAVHALLRTLATWSSVSALRLTAGGVTASRCFADAAGDGRIVVVFGDPCDEIADTSPVLALGAAFLDTSDTRLVNGAPYAAITSGLVVVDDAPGKVDALGAVCLEELVTHEIGHTLGLGHSTDTASLMFPALSPTCGARPAALPLSPGDHATMQARYPVASGGEPPASPIGLMAAVFGADVRLRWSDGAGAAATSYRVVAGSAPGESDLGDLAVGAAGLDVSGVGRGVYYLRVVAMNAAGASAPSAEITVVVGDGVAGAPTGLMGAADAVGRVRLYWQRPVSQAHVTGYVLLVRVPDDGRLLRVPVDTTSLYAEGVAPGAYPIRVAAVTDAGVGPASAEILVVVP